MALLQSHHRLAPCRMSADLLQVAMLPVKAGGASFEAGAVQLPYRGGEYYGVCGLGTQEPRSSVLPKPQRCLPGTQAGLKVASLHGFWFSHPIQLCAPPPAAVVAAPRGELSSDAAQNGQRGLVTPKGLVPYGEALTACRQQVSAGQQAGLLGWGAAGCCCCCCCCSGLLCLLCTPLQDMAAGVEAVPGGACDTAARVCCLPCSLACRCLRTCPQRAAATPAAARGACQRPM